MEEKGRDKEVRVWSRVKARWQLSDSLIVYMRNGARPKFLYCHIAPADLEVLNFGNGVHRSSKNSFSLVLLGVVSLGGVNGCWRVVSVLS